jgi:hypothetical protein
MRVMSSVGRCGRRDDPFPERFHTKEEVKVRKKLVKVINAVKILKASGALSAAGAAAKVGGSGSGSRLNARRRAIKIVPFIGNKEKVTKPAAHKRDEERKDLEGKVVIEPTFAKDVELDRLLRKMVDQSSPDFPTACEAVSSHLRKQLKRRKAKLKLKVRQHYADRPPRECVCGL